jgi:hypothetical protein
MSLYLSFSITSINYCSLSLSSITNLSCWVLFIFEVAFLDCFYFARYVSKRLYFYCSWDSFFDSSYDWIIGLDFYFYSKRMWYFFVSNDTYDDFYATCLFNNLFYYVILVKSSYFSRYCKRPNVKAVCLFYFTYTVFCFIFFVFI